MTISPTPPLAGAPDLHAFETWMDTPCKQGKGMQDAFIAGMAHQAAKPAQSVSMPDALSIEDHETLRILLATLDKHQGTIERCARDAAVIRKLMTLAAPLPQPQADSDERTPAVEGGIDSISDDLGFAEVLGEYNFQSARGNALAASMPLTRYIDAWHSARLPRTAAPSEPMTFDQFFDEAERKGLTLNDLLPGVKAKLAEMEQKGEIVKHEDGGHAWALVNRGEQPEDTAHLDCPHCGGSGHKDDVAPAPLEAQPIPTDLSKRLRAKANLPFGPADFALLTQAADEIDRYYGGMLNWKAAPEAPTAAQVPEVAEARIIAILTEQQEGVKKRDGDWWRGYESALHWITKAITDKPEGDE